VSHDLPTIASKLRGAGFRVTPQRQMILDAVCALGGHVTPEAVYEHVQATHPTISRATVYRTLNFLSELRILSAADIGGGHFGYEFAGPEPHHHLVCRACGDEVELPHSALRHFFAEVEAQHDFLVDDRHLSFSGLCAACRNGY
jgi:Fe2+ or Zn2+ uptake regulation protein